MTQDTPIVPLWWLLHILRNPTSHDPATVQKAQRQAADMLEAAYGKDD